MNPNNVYNICTTIVQIVFHFLPGNLKYKLSTKHFLKENEYEYFLYKQSLHIVPKSNLLIKDSAAHEKSTPKAQKRPITW